jgi:hypothetical protein
MFAGLRPDPRWDRVPADQLARESRNYHFDFAGGRHILGAWVKVESDTTLQPVTFQMSWKPSHGSASSRSYRATVPGNAEDVLVWIDQTIGEAAIDCDRQKVRIVRIDFLVPHFPTEAIQQ